MQMEELHSMMHEVWGVSAIEYKLFSPEAIHTIKSVEQKYLPLSVPESLRRESITTFFIDEEDNHIAEIYTKPVAEDRSVCLKTKEGRWIWLAFQQACR